MKSGQNMTPAFRLLAILLLIVLVAPSARAQMCDTAFEVITTLRPPTFGFPTVWDAQYERKDQMVQFKSGVPMEGGTVFAVGRSLSKTDFKPQEIVLAELNRRGRALKEVAYPAKDGEDPVKMIRVGNELIVLSNISAGAGHQDKRARLSWYDLDGKYKREKILQDATFQYEARTLVPSVEQKGFIAVIYAVNRKDEKDQNGLLIRFSPQGEQLWRRAYRPGIPNELTNLIPVGDANYLATGRIRLDDGRMSAWALKLAYDGAVQWQRTYPRGGFSIFNHAALSAAHSPEGIGFVLAGDSKPLDDGPIAAWVMELDALGEPVWQRYFRRDDYEFAGKWILRQDDGRSVVVMNAKAVEGEGGQNHVRMLTLSPRGAMIQDESYFEGLQAVGWDYVPGWNGERIVISTIEDDAAASEEEDQPIKVIGLAKDEDVIEENPALPERPVYKGWVFVATALDPYTDPCKPRQRSQSQ